MPDLTAAEKRVRDTNEALRLSRELSDLARRVRTYDNFAGSLLEGLAYKVEGWAGSHPYDEDGNLLPGAPEVGA